MRMLALLLIAAVLAPAHAAPAKSIADLIVELGDYRQDVRQAASRALSRLPRARVLEVAADMARRPAHRTEDAIVCPQALALNLLDEWGDRRAADVALGCASTEDPDLREAAARIVASLEGPAADRFLAGALVRWGREDLAGMRMVLHGLEPRMGVAAVRKAVLDVLMAPIPPADPRFRYEAPHEPPREGDRHRLWLYKADGCLFLIRHHPWPDARPAVLRALDVPELRVEALGGLAELGWDGAPERIRAVLVAETATEPRLAAYRALFRLRADTPQDAEDARNLFTATAAPSGAWLQGLGAMVALFEARGDEPALRVVALWKLQGAPVKTRDAALQAMRRAHPDIYQRVIGAR